MCQRKHCYYHKEEKKTWKTEEKRQAIINIDSFFFPDSTLPRKVNLNIKYWAPFWRCASGYFLPPLELPKWQRSKSLCCHCSMQVKIFLLRKCTCPMSLECKKDHHPLGLKPLSPTLPSSCQKQRESFILSEKWALNWVLPTHELLSIKCIAYWLQILLHLYLFNVWSAEIHFSSWEIHHTTNGITFVMLHNCDI